MGEQQMNLPPANIEAEQNVLGAMMHDCRKFDVVADILEATDFYRRDHQLIFEAITSLAAANTPCDAVTLSEALERTGKLDEVGGLPYLGKLQNDVVALNAKAYAHIVKERSVERALSQAGVEITNLTYEKIPVRDKIDKAQSLVQCLTEDHHHGGLTQVRSMLKLSIDGLEQRFHHPGTLTGLSFGLAELDRLTLGAQRTNLIVIAGRPSMGKTTLVMILVIATAVKAKQPVAVFSLEMSATELTDRLICAIGKIDSHAYRSGKVQDTDWPRITAAVSQLHDAPLFIDDTPALNINQVRARARRIKREHGLALVVVDYLQLMSGYGENRTQVISEISRGLKALAKELGVPVVALSQLNRGLENRTNKRPTLADLRESGQIEQDADLIVFIYRDEVYHEDSPDKGIAEIIIGKQRNGETGTVLSTFRGEHYLFDDFTGTRPAKAESKIKPLKEVYNK